MITDTQIRVLKRDAQRPNYGSRYCSLGQLLAVIEAYEALKAELAALKLAGPAQGELFATTEDQLCQTN